MMKEIELKFKVDDVAALELVSKMLHEKHFIFQGEEESTDTYYEDIFGNLLQHNEWFRVRKETIFNETEYSLTFKGPKEKDARTEFNIGVSSKDIYELLEVLGFTKLVVVEKRRSSYQRVMTPFVITVCLDDVLYLGQFVEIEILGDETQLEAARRLLYSTATLLGLTQQEDSSYAQMILKNA